MEAQKSFTETHRVTIKYDNEGRKIINNYVMLNVIGKGSYAKVKLGLNLNDNKYYAIKIISKEILSKKKKSYGRGSDGYMSITYMLEDALNEIEILKKLNEEGGHFNIVKLFEIIYDDERQKIYLVIEYLEKGPILNYNDRTGVFSINKAFKGTYYSEEQLLKFLKDLAAGLEFSK